MHQPQAELVRFALLLARLAGLCDVKTLLQDPVRVADNNVQHHAEQERPPELFEAVTVLAMSKFVREDHRQPLLGLDFLEEARCNADTAPGDCHCVRTGKVNERQFVRKRPEFRGARQLAEDASGSFEFRIVDRLACADHAAKPCEPPGLRLVGDIVDDDVGEESDDELGNQEPDNGFDRRSKPAPEGVLSTGDVGCLDEFPGHELHFL